MNETVETEIMMPFVEGTEVYIPVKCHMIGEGVIRVLENDEFDYEDQSVIFEFGPHDTVRTASREFSDGTVKETAFELVSSGDNRNDEKRMLLAILRENVGLSVLIERFGKEKVWAFVENHRTLKSPYPGIQNWFLRNTNAIGRID
ncbi:hypothetical protein ACSFA0_21530 [Variovorax sp. LT1P1]|uniref:hypothetical protein n=1 Tax=Variovorax sp. LT1P1 TaxID=3443730 RepID=UPI003F452B9B